MSGPTAGIGKAGQQPGMDGGGGLAVQLLVDDGLGEGLKGGLTAGQAHGEWPGASDEFAQFGVGCGERGNGGGSVIGQLAGLGRVRHGYHVMIPANGNTSLDASYNLSYKIRMQLKLRKIGNGYGVLFPKQLMEEMKAGEGMLIEVNKVEGGHMMTPADAEFTRQVEAFLRTEHLHRNTYRELAK